MLAAGTTQAALTIYTGADPSANGSDPRPFSDAAAAAFDSAAGTTSLIDFESASIGAFTSLAAGPGATLTGADVSANPQTIVNSPIGSPDSLYGYNTTSGGANFASFYGGSMTLTFATPVTAFGAYFSGLQIPSENVVTANFEGGGSETVGTVLNDGGIEFIGFTSNVGITSVFMDMPGDIVGVDDIRYSAVPEPATMAVLGLGLAAAARRRKQA